MKVEGPTWRLKENWRTKVSFLPNKNNKKKSEKDSPGLQVSNSTRFVCDLCCAGLEGCQSTPNSVCYVLDLLNLNLNGWCNDWVREHTIFNLRVSLCVAATGRWMWEMFLSMSFKKEKQAVSYSPLGCLFDRSKSYPCCFSVWMIETDWV